MPDLSLIRAEWLKLRSVPRWVVALALAGVITVAFSTFVGSASGGEGGSGEPVTIGPEGHWVEDDFHFVHQSMTGDGTVTVQVTSLTGADESGNPTVPQPWAKAGVMVKESTEAGSEYAAVLTTPEHGVRLQSNFTTDIGGSDSGAPRWLRLERESGTLTGFESTDGQAWEEIGSVTLDGLPDTVEAGFFVASPPEVEVVRRSGGAEVGATSTIGVATFDNVDLDAAGSTGEWTNDDIGNGAGDEVGAILPAGSADQAGDEFTVSGSGDIADSPQEDDVVQLSLVGVVIGSLAIIAVSVLFVTTEYRRGMIRTTFAARPRRSAVLSAKALVAGGVTFVVGLAACFGAFLLAYPLLRENGFAPPYYPEPSLTDPDVLRAIVGSAAVLALVAVLSVAVSMIVRRSAAGIAIMTALFFVPAFLGQGLTPTLADALVRITPAGGLAVQRAQPPADIVVDSFATISPWSGFGVLMLYVVAALGVAGVMVHRRDA